MFFLRLMLLLFVPGGPYLILLHHLQRDDAQNPPIPWPAALAIGLLGVGLTGLAMWAAGYGWGWVIQDGVVPALRALFLINAIGSIIVGLFASLLIVMPLLMMGKIVQAIWAGRKQKPSSPFE